MKINLYVKDNCYKCKNVELRLKSKGVEFNAINVSHDEEALAKAKSSGFSAMPIFEINDEFTFSDFSIPKIDQLIKDYKEQTA